MEVETVLFMTWAREYVDSLTTKMLPGKFYYDVFGSYNEAQDSLANSYNKIGAEINAKVAPVGLIWKEIHAKYPDSKLWRKDHNHPTEIGTVIATYAIYATIFNESAKGLRCPVPVPAPIVRDIQEITNQKIFDDTKKINKISTNELVNLFIELK